MLLNKKTILFFILLGLAVSYSITPPRTRDITTMPIVPVCDDGDTTACSTPPIYETKIMLEINSTDPKSIMGDMLVIGINRFNSSDRISMDNVPIYYFAVCSDNKKIISNSITDSNGILSVNITDFMKTCSDCSIVVFRYCPIVHTDQGLKGCLAINEDLSYYGLSTMTEIYTRENNTIDSQTYSYCKSTKGDVDRTTCLLITLMFAFLGGAMYLAGGSPFRMVGFTRTKMPKTRMYQMRPKSMSFTMMGISSLGGKLVSGAMKKIGKNKGGGDEKEEGNANADKSEGGDNPENDPNFVGPPQAPPKSPPKMFRTDSKMSKAMGKVRGGYVNMVGKATGPVRKLGKAIGGIPILGGMIGIRNEGGGNQQQARDPRLASMGIGGGGGGALDDIANPKQITGTNFGEIFSSVASAVLGQMYQGMLNHYTGGLGQYAIGGLQKLGGSKSWFGLKAKKQWTGFLKVLGWISNPFGKFDNWIQNINVKKMKKKVDKLVTGLQENGEFTQKPGESAEQAKTRIEKLLRDVGISIKGVDPTTGFVSLKVGNKTFTFDDRDIGSIGSELGIVGAHIASGLKSAQHMSNLLYRDNFWNALENFRKDYANAKSEAEKTAISKKVELFLKTNGIDIFDPQQMSFGENFMNFVTGKSGPKKIGELRQNLTQTYNRMLDNIGTAFVSMSLDLNAAERMKAYGASLNNEELGIIEDNSELFGAEYQKLKEKIDAKIGKIEKLERAAAEAKANGDDELSDKYMRKASEKRAKLNDWIDEEINKKGEKLEEIQKDAGWFGRIAEDKRISREDIDSRGKEPGVLEMDAGRRIEEAQTEMLGLKLGIMCLVSVGAGGDLPDSVSEFMTSQAEKNNVDMHSMIEAERKTIQSGTAYLANSYDIYAQGMANSHFYAYGLSDATIVTQMSSFSDPTKNLTLEQNIILGMMSANNEEKDWYSQMIENQTKQYGYIYSEISLASQGLSVLGEMDASNGSLWQDKFSELSNDLKDNLISFEEAGHVFTNKNTIEDETQKYKDLMIESDIINGVMDVVDKPSNRQNYVDDYHNKENVMLENQTQFVGLYGTEEQQTSYNELEGNLVDLKGRLESTVEVEERTALITEIVETKTNMENIGHDVIETIKNESNSNIANITEQFEEERKRNDDEARRLANDDAELRERLMERDALLVQRYEAQVAGQDPSSIDDRILDVRDNIMEIVPEKNQQSMQETLDRRDDIHLTRSSELERINDDFGPRLSEGDNYLNSQNAYEQSRNEFANKVFVSGPDYDRFEGIQKQRERELEEGQRRISSIIDTPQETTHTEERYWEKQIDMMAAIASTSDRIADRVGAVFEGNENVDANMNVITGMSDRFAQYKQNQIDAEIYGKMKDLSGDILESNDFVKNLVSTDNTMETIDTQVFWKTPKKTDNRYSEFKSSISENFGSIVDMRTTIKELTEGDEDYQNYSMLKEFVGNKVAKDMIESEETKRKLEKIEYLGKIKARVRGVVPELGRSVSNPDMPWREANKILDRGNRAFKSAGDHKGGETS